MNTGGRQPIDDAISPLPTGCFGERLERLWEESGLTWPKLAASAGIAGRDAIPLRRVERFQPGPGHKGIVALGRDLSGGCGLTTGGNDAGDQNGNRAPGANGG